MKRRGQPVRLLMTADAVGGVWQYALDLARALVPLGYDTTLALLGPTATADQRAAAAIAGVSVVETGLPLDWLADGPADVTRAGAAIAALAESVGADLLQLNQPALAADTIFGVPTIAVSHSCLATWWQAVEGGAPPADFAWRIALHGAGLRAANRVVTPSRAFALATADAYELTTLPLAIHNGRAGGPASAAQPAQIAFTAGRLWDRGKDVATLDRAAGRLDLPVCAAGPIAGPNGDGVRLEHVRAVGVLSDAALADRLAAEPIFVSSARYEPFGLAVLEAAAAGCALVLSDIPTFRELWDEAAIFVACGDDRAFAEVIRRLAADPAARAAQGARATARAARYTPARTAAAMARLYADLLPQRTAERAA